VKPPPILTGFARGRPPKEVPQARILEWLADAHATAEAAREGLDDAARERFAARIRHVIEKCACRPDKIASRGVSIEEVGSYGVQRIYDLRSDPHGAGTSARMQVFSERVGAYFADAFPPDATPPRDLVHVTCTGYASPSAAQALVSARGWGARTRVTHAYHMGCYAALPSVRLAAGLVALDAEYGVDDGRVDLVHTELCSLHLDPGDHRIEQLVVQSLFADGLIRYTLHAGGDGAPAGGFTLLALAERIVPDSTDAMTWVVSDHGMAMTLARDVPERIGGALRDLVDEVFARAGRDPGAARGAIYAVHPGGPRIIDGVRDRLELAEAQVAHSRGVLHDHGNMSSATLPHVWQRIAEDPAVAPGTLVATLAFGPGLTACAALFEKRP
jgi:predicted naringenin-chalcone synthase